MRHAIIALSAAGPCLRAVNLAAALLLTGSLSLFAFYEGRGVGLSAGPIVIAQGPVVTR